MRFIVYLYLSSFLLSGAQWFGLCRFFLLSKQARDILLPPRDPLLAHPVFLSVHASAGTAARARPVADFVKLQRRRFLR